MKQHNFTMTFEKIIRNSFEKIHHQPLFTHVFFPAMKGKKFYWSHHYFQFKFSSSAISPLHPNKYKRLHTKGLFVLTENIFGKKISFAYIILLQIKGFYIHFITYN